MYQPNPKVQKFHTILEPIFPEWLREYINVPALLKQEFISITCGIYYTNLVKNPEFYSSLDHSVGVALVVWHFTHDKKQTLAGLFHDIATPAFKHCLDVLNGDYMTQESTEDLTTTFIKNSPEIMGLLKRDGIKLEEIDDYHLYPIADNDTPQLSADRLEYSFAHALFTFHLMNFNQVKKFYNDIEIQHNSIGQEELGFKTKTIAREFVKITSEQSIYFRDNRMRYSMQLIADIMKKLNELGKITIDDLYDLKESEVIEIINHSDFGDAFNKWQTAESIRGENAPPTDSYFVHHPMKVRYIDPLISGERASDSDAEMKNMIDKNLAYSMDDYVYLPGLNL